MLAGAFLFYQRNVTSWLYDFCLLIVHRIVHAPLLAEAVHELHDIQRLLVRHLTRLQQSVDESLPTSNELILVARYLLRHPDGLDVSAIRTIHRDGLRIVDIVDNQITLGTCDDTDIITYAGCARLQIAEHTILEHQRDGVCQVHTGLTLHTLALDAGYVCRKEHSDEIEGIDTEVEQRTATEVGPSLDRKSGV